MAGKARDQQWLDDEQARAWLAYMRVQLRLAYEMNRQLQADSGLSLSDYDVLNALSSAPGGCMQITSLAATIGWERSRLSHHVKRMSRRGLVTSDLAPSDRRVTEVSLTVQGRHTLAGAAPGHVALVRRLFFDGLSKESLPQLSKALETIYENILANGTLPRPDVDRER
ncbi:MarR family winged helix-turn-helix transcriptional regulator [Lentzea sp. NPDC004782]|uniref:MarR family winged helix-turn-helix transcriptional regulator n=1 Tax=Lentzea sp. NPDC004782 TaxID=3154458 RepID=UPI0033BDD7BA